MRGLFVPSHWRLVGALLGCLLLSAMLPDTSAWAQHAPAPDNRQASSFPQWLAQFRQRMLAKGISQKTFDDAFAGVEPDPAVIKADGSQPEFIRPIWSYLDDVLATVRISRGKRLLAENAAILRRIEQTYGVDREVLVAIWGMESSFGQNAGHRSVIRSLATLAYDGRRPEFAEQQLADALQILQRGDISASDMKGSWAGAMGQTQFMPSTYLQYAVDFDGDGRRDIWNSTADALASAANYLKSYGWRSGQRWGIEVTLPTGFDYAQADDSIERSLAEWRRRGVQLPDNTWPDNISAEEPLKLLLPAGYRGPAFLVSSNYYVILNYNNSTSYALGISLLSEAFNGYGRVQAPWPRDDTPLTRSQGLDLQQRLAKLGYDPGKLDGLVGNDTRKAIRAYQKQQGLPVDGYPDQNLLKRLQQP